MNVLGCLLAVLAMCLAYLCSHNQRLRAYPLGRGAKIAAWVAGAGALFAWIAGETSLPGVFATLTALMFGAVALPYVSWLLRPAAARKPR